ncbi:CPBP family intramembrane metalloprotease [Calidifontibacter sp. DB0510]|uniref:CPBP family intramembrane metalloprotease n=1 Tax=Metallococcus carri TaxID=1656884 RepID=A0A967AZP5_9MICO|nr:CPBP family intramembrane glutamic endopeptidase [Metallococcus carri]NHN54718.1 CPBP family intramembrane metalloprotease [Metallococcus carri]NOP37063.1 CPBP family intramembrane metalloprotease [Calidifontibacter sp. DB2511S]
MVAPVEELREFVRAALIDPVPRNHQESDAAFHRRRVVAVVTLVIGTAVLAYALRVPPGDPRFYAATGALAVVWAVGAWSSGPLHLGRARTRNGRYDVRPVLQPLVVGLLLLGVFLIGAIVVARVPVLRGPVDALLDHARFGSLPLVAALTAVNGIAEELYFRGAAFAAVGRRYPVLITTIAYAAVTAFSGVPLLVLAGAVLGLVTGLQRRVTGGILAPIITHLTWSLGMLLLLPPALNAFG